MEDIQGHTFVEVMSEKYSPDNFPYRRGPGMGVVVVPVAGPQGSPMKGESPPKVPNPPDDLRPRRVGLRHLASGGGRGRSLRGLTRPCPRPPQIV